MSRDRKKVNQSKGSGYFMLQQSQSCPSSARARSVISIPNYLGPSRADALIWGLLRLVRHLQNLARFQIIPINTWVAVP
jgi:hypothetical protein